MTEAAATEPGAPSASAAMFPMLSLSGGPLHALGRRVGLVSARGNAFALGVALGWTPWLILFALAAMQGALGQFMSVTVLAGHVRLLLVIPLLFLCESTLNAHAGDFVVQLLRAGVVPRESLPALLAEIERERRWANSWVLDLTALLAAAFVSWLAGSLHPIGRTAALDPMRSFADMPLAAPFYWLFCLPLFRFVLFRFLWRLLLWWRFLWRLSRTPLHLVPTHPDRVGGLGFLEIVQMRLAPLVLAISALAAAGFAEGISAGRSAFEVVYPEMALTILLSLLIVLGPPCVFAFKLRDCQERGLRSYGVLASRYVADFERKWIDSPPPRDEPFLGSADLQSLADLGNSINVVREMRMAPVSTRLLTVTFAVAIMPMLPIFLFKYPVAELVKRLFMKLTGL